MDSHIIPDSSLDVFIKNNKSNKDKKSLEYRDSKSIDIDNNISIDSNVDKIIEKYGFKNKEVKNIFNKVKKVEVSF